MRTTAFICSTIPEVQNAVFDVFQGDTNSITITKVRRLDTDRDAWMVEIS